MRGTRNIFLALGLALAVPAYAHHHGNGSWDYSNPGQQPSQNSPVPQNPQGVPTCVDKQGSPMDVNNDEVLQWKSSTPNQYLDRGYIRGTLVQVYPAAHGHLHIEVNIGGGNGSRDSNIEVIYNEDFGEVTGTISPGAEIIACGDYITSTRQSGPYPPSPDGAILHWVHKAMNGNHPSGFLMINGELFGQMDAAPRPGHSNDFFQGLVSPEACVGRYCDANPTPAPTACVGHYCTDN